MPEPRVHYLDYAATSAVRPPAVAEAVSRFLSEVGATPGRGGHRLAVEAGRLALRCRAAVVRVLGLGEDPSRLAFTQNATHALNTALFGVLSAGDVAVVSPYDHNSVFRPLYHLAQARGVETRLIPGDERGVLDLEAARRLLDGARLLVFSGASNVLGTRLPIRRLTQLAHEAGALVLLDAAQWAGHFSADLAGAGVDMVAFTGHKGLLGPQGIGGLWVRPGLDLAPTLFGGTGGASNLPTMPEAFPDRLEAGSANAPGMAGLLAGIEYLESEGLDDLHVREMGLKRRLRAELDALAGVRVLSPAGDDGVAIVTVISSRVPPSEMARALDRDWGVLVRHGLNCAPEVHKILGTSGTGAVRFSLGWASTDVDVDRAVEAVDAVVSRSGPHGS